jgi:retinol dehydrogenase-12
VIASDVWRPVPWPFRVLIKLFMASPEDGARTSLYCATAPELAGQSGRYYDDCTEKRPSRHAAEQLARRLWEQSETWTAG